MQQIHTIYYKKKRLRNFLNILYISVTIRLLNGWLTHKSTQVFSNVFFFFTHMLNSVVFVEWESEKMMQNVVWVTHIKSFMLFSIIQFHSCIASEFLLFRCGSDSFMSPFIWKSDMSRSLFMHVHQRSLHALAPGHYNKYDRRFDSTF